MVPWLVRIRSHLKAAPDDKETLQALDALLGDGALSHPCLLGGHCVLVCVGGGWAHASQSPVTTPPLHHRR
jgi:hypothetical protein